MELKIGTLQKEYDVKLSEYQEAVNTYISLLESDEATQVFTSLPGRTWWGTQALDEKKVENLQECENMCKESNECSGATYHEESRYCWTRKGNSSITKGREEDYALVPQLVASLERMKYLNQELMKMNAIILSELNNIETKTEPVDKVERRKRLEDNYERLLEQQTQVDRHLEEYNSMEEEQNTQQIYTDQQHTQYKWWTLLAGILLLVAIKGFHGAESSGSFFTYGITLLVLAVTISFALKTPSGLFAIFLLVVAIAGTKMNDKK